MNAKIDNEAITLRNILLIQRERIKQQSKWGDDHDDSHRSGELIDAAVAVLQGNFLHPWKLAYNDAVIKPIKDRLRIAASLILAEMDRIDRDILRRI